MKRTMKKMVSMALTGTMAVAVLAGAGTSEVKAADKAKIGVLVADVSGEEAQGFRSYLRIISHSKLRIFHKSQSAVHDRCWKRDDCLTPLGSKLLNCCFLICHKNSSILLCICSLFLSSCTTPRIESVFSKEKAPRRFLCEAPLLLIFSLYFQRVK